MVHNNTVKKYVKKMSVLEMKTLKWMSDKLAAH